MYIVFTNSKISQDFYLKKDLLNSLNDLKVMGTILLSPEGINVNMSQSEKI